MKMIYDVVITGGGMAGVAAAVAASRLGARTLLVEQGSVLGGLGTAGGLSNLITWAPGFYGIGLELVNRLVKTGGMEFNAMNRDNFYDLEYMKLALDELVCGSGAELLLFAKATDITQFDGKVSALELCGQEGKFAVYGRYFIDCTGDAMLAFMAGEPYELGDGNGNTQAPTLVCQYIGVDWDAYRAFLEPYGGDNVPMIREILPRAVAAGDVRITDFHHPGVFRVNDRVALVNIGHAYGADCLSPKGLTEATLEGRRQAHEYLKFYRKYIPGFADAYMTFTAATIGVRETRRLIGQYTVTFEDKSSYRKFDDAVMRFEGGRESDLHSYSPSMEAYMDYYTLFTDERPRDDDWADLPYRCLLPQKAKNLLVAGRCLSADRKVQGRVRTMGYCLMMGQAAGTAAALCAREGMDCDRIDITSLQSELFL